MKKYIVLFLSVCISLVLCPLCVYSVSGTQNKVGSRGTDSTELLSEDSTVRVLISEADEVISLSFRDYIIGVVAAEMPAEFHSEALSACAVAAATLTRKNQQTKDSVLSDDPAVFQAYLSIEKMHERWGGDFSTYYEKICSAVDKSIGYSICYEGELITAAYHAISSGITESAENIWSEALPYLVEAESEGDRLSPKYASEKKVTTDFFIREMNLRGAELEKDSTPVIKNPLYSKAGTLISVNIGKKSFSGEELRDIFSLRSPAIEITASENEVIFSVTGYGHGVGMSQYGADYYARQGLSWQEIILHYYTGVEIVEI